MAEVRPFRGILYSPQRVKDITDVVTEPYDVISPAQQKLYYQNHPYNIIRLILGRRYWGDNSRNNQYTRAKKYFTHWQRSAILVRDKRPSTYIYTQSFMHEGKRKTRTGFIILLKIEDFAKNTVLPHEDTFSHPVQDRLKLIRAVQANLSPIFTLFNDPQGKVEELMRKYKRTHHCYLSIKKDNVCHQIWRMGEQKKIGAIQKLLKGRPIFIADGHHRYEAALNYRRQMLKKKGAPGGLRPYDYVMVYLVATASPGLTILPTHRVLKTKGSFSAQKIIASLKDNFTIHKFSSSGRLFSFMRKRQPGKRIFGAYLGKGRFYGLSLKKERFIDKLAGKGSRALGKDLDVTILHKLIISEMSSYIPFSENIHYTKDAQEAIQMVNRGKNYLAFFIRPPQVKQLKRIASLGEKMPHKSTYFYPKPLTGLVINAF